MFSFSSSSSSQDEMVSRLELRGYIKSERAAAAMRAVDRKDFVLPEEELGAYTDHPSPIGHSATISAPHMHSIAVELLSSNLVPGAKVLDVGSGSGYLTAVFAYMVDLLHNPESEVRGYDCIPALVTLSHKNLAKHHKALLENTRFSLVVGDGWVPDNTHPEGWFDAIHVGAAAARMPISLLAQLAPGGKMMLPYGGPISWLSAQNLLAITRLKTAPTKEEHLPTFHFTPGSDKELEDMLLDRHAKVVVTIEELGGRAFMVETSGGVCFVPLVER